MAAPARWSPPSLREAPDTTALWNALVSHMGQPLALRGQAAAVVEIAEAPAPDAVCIALRFAAGPDLVVLPLTFPFAAMFDADLAIEDFPLLPEALRDALYAGVVATYAAVLPEHGLGEVETTAIAPVAERVPPTEALRWFRVTLHGPTVEPLLFQVGASMASLAQVFGGALASRPVWPGLKAKLTREAAVTLGRLVLPWAQLRRLAQGTVVVLDADVEATARLRLGSDLFHFRYLDQGWTCTAAESTQTRDIGRGSGGDGTEMAMDQIPPTPQGAGPAEVAATDASISDRFTVAVDFDLGRIAVSLAELETWQVGSIVALQPPSPREGVEVALRANGQMIGTGELVRIDDRLAVRIAGLSLGG